MRVAKVQQNGQWSNMAAVLRDKQYVIIIFYILRLRFIFNS